MNKEKPGSKLSMLEKMKGYQRYLNLFNIFLLVTSTILVFTSIGKLNFILGVLNQFLANVPKISSVP